MDQSELETYQVQLSQVETALKDDPENAELQDLQSELKQLIELTQSAVAQSQAAQVKPEATRKTSQSVVAGAGNGKAWAAGDECLAKYSSDGSWYPARITSVGGAAENRVYSIVFKGYNTTELVKANEIKPLTASYLSGPGPYSNGGPSSGGSNKRKVTKEEEDEREKKKKKNEKKLELRATKAKEQNEKKASWQKFAKKSEKKGIHIAGISGTSIFKTPDNPYGKGGGRRSDVREQAC